MSALVSLPENCGANPDCFDCSCSIETEAPGLLSGYLFMGPYFFPIFLNCLLLSVPNMNYVQKGTSYFRSRNLDGRNPTFYSQSIYLGWMWDNFSYQDLNPFYKGDNSFWNMIFSNYSCYSIRNNGLSLLAEMFSSDKVCALVEFSSMTVDPSYSNPIFSKFSTLEESMYNILSFEIV